MNNKSSLIKNYKEKFDNILFLKNGVKAWEGTKEDIFLTENEAIVEFVYSSELFKKVREAYVKG
jgi:phospholipid/cholesterol/gamma-HCH transport system ATP-binding protein